MGRLGALGDWIKNCMWRGRERRQRGELPDDELIKEIWQAHREWQIAQHKFQYALGQDQIDYAIYIIEATEKRYEMLLRQAKERERLRLLKPAGEFGDKGQTVEG